MTPEHTVKIFGGLKSIFSDVTLFGFQTLRLRSGQQIDWLKGERPADEPECGFTGERCKPTDSKHILFL